MKTDGAKKAGAPARCFAAFFLAAAVLAFSGPARATPMVVTSLGDFNSAVGAAPTTSDSFGSDIIGDLSITFASGVVSTAAEGYQPSGAVIPNRVSDGRFSGTVDFSERIGPATLTWTFPFSVIGFAAVFSRATASPLIVTIPGAGPTFNVSGDSVFFFGLVDTMAPFTQIQFSAGGDPLFESFIADNLVFAAAPTVTAVPEPASLALFALGLAGLAGLGYRRRRTG